MEGWVKFHRKIEEHWIWKNDKYFKAWAYILFRANFTAAKVLVGATLVELQRGEFITSRQNFATAAGMTERETRTFWSLLEKDKMIVKKSTKQMTRIKVLNYESYQVERPTNDQQPTNEGPTDDQRTTTDKKEKKVKKVKNNINFEFEVMGYAGQYPEDMLQDFIRYWGEWNKAKTKMKYEMQQTWDLTGRLATWFKRSNYTSVPKGNSTDSDF